MSLHSDTAERPRRPRHLNRWSELPWSIHFETNECGPSIFELVSFVSPCRRRRSVWANYRGYCTRPRGARSSHNSSLRSTCTTIQGTRRDPKPVSTRPVLGRATPQHEAPDGACHCPSCDGVRRGRSDDNDSRALRGKPTERMRRHRSRVPPSIPTSSSYLAPSASALRPIFQTKLPL